MISGKLVRLIESHGGDIICRIIDQVRREPHMTHLRTVLEPEIHEYGEALLKNLGHWLAAGNDEELAHKYERLGKLRCEQNVPLEESVRGLFIIREKMLDYVDEHILSKDALELYAEEALDRQLGRFFDILTIHLVRGYENALRHPAAAARA